MSEPNEYAAGFRDGLQAAWDAIDAWIKVGHIPDRGQSERRNGMVLAANVVMEMIKRGMQQ